MSRTTRRHGLRAAFCVAAAMLLIGVTLPVDPCRAADTAMGEIIAPDATVRLEVRKGQIVRLERPAAAVFVADPDTADVQVHSPSLVYVLGRRAGTTSLFAVDAHDRVLLRRDVVVTHNLSGLRSVLQQIAPEDAPTVTSIDGGILLEGAIADPRTAQDVREATQRYLGQDETIINRLAIGGSTQVNLRVRVAEISREAFKLFGFNWDALVSSPGDFVFGLATGRPLGGLAPRLSDSMGTAGTLSGSYSNSNVNIDGVVDALEREGFVNVLAEPNLTALSGETASFLAGGEFPVPVGVNDNEVQIQFKQFGVSLAFTPTVLGPDRISLKVRPEVSELTDNGAIKLNNLVIPALATRRAETTVELGSGQSFAIGGLISNATRTNVEQFPGLGSLPVLGTLFRSSNFRHQELELVIIATPYLVRPVHAPALAVPNDGLRAPSDLERILLGRVVVAAGTSLPVGGRGRRLLGPAGFTID